MSASKTPSAAPPYALRIWADGRSVYTEIPPSSPDGQPHVLSFALTDGGLGKALALLRKRHTDFAGVPYIKPPLPAKPGDTQRAHAHAVLKRMGIL